MATFPVNQNKPNMKKDNSVSSKKLKTPRVKLSEPKGYTPSQGDLGILKVQGSDIARMVKAPTRTGDSLTNHVGKVGSAMKKMGMLS